MELAECGLRFRHYVCVKIAEIVKNLSMVKYDERNFVGCLGHCVNRVTARVKK